MILDTRFATIAKTFTMCAIGAVVLTACSDKGAGATKASSGQQTAFEVETDHGLGDPKAPITVVEYASVTCGHCASWHETVWPDFNEKFVKTGKVRYIYRPFPAGNPELANAGHLLAFCAGDDKFFAMIGVQMKRQRQILSSDSKVKAQYIALAKTAGMSEADFDACMANQEQIDKLSAITDAGINAGVSGTPTFFINGTKYDAQDVFFVKDFEKIFAPILGEAVPTPTPTPTENSPAPDATPKVEN